ncbi:MAG TPA: hypothetical protein VHF86_11095 [Xanthomonadaceae bacterium]|nr:hypothetical protein [Xanthomonadaceae bacterium]
MSVQPVASSTVVAPTQGPFCLEPRPMTDAAALEIFNRRFGAFDTAAEGGEADGKVSREDLQAVVEHGADQDLVDAAAHLLEHDALHGALDTAGERGDRDGLISAKDLTSHIVRSEPGAMPLLDTLQVAGSAGNPTVLQIDADAPEGASWANQDGTRAGIVSVYVDGEYVGDATVFAENPGGAEVNLGVLGPGAHTIELRDSTRVGIDADTGIDPASVSARPRELDIRSSDPVERDQALAAKYAPNLALADEHQATNNTPLLTTAQVIHHDDGTTTIAYRIVYSNEDGGDGEDPAMLANRWGRTTDDERIYEVTIDADGEVIDFSGKNGAGGLELPDDDRGVREMQAARGANGLPSLAIANEHNNVRWDDPADRHNRAYSGVPVLVAAGPNTGRDASNEPGPPTNAVMADHPWTWRVANAEMAREGKLDEVAPHDRLYFSLDEGVFEGTVEVEVVLRNGRTETLELQDVKGSSNSASLVLPFPPGEVASVRIAGVDGADLHAYYLDDLDTPKPVTTTD